MVKTRTRVSTGLEDTTPTTSGANADSGSELESHMPADPETQADSVTPTKREATEDGAPAKRPRIHDGDDNHNDKDSSAEADLDRAQTVAPKSAPEDQKTVIENSSQPAPTEVNGVETPSGEEDKVEERNTIENISQDVGEKEVSSKATAVEQPPPEVAQVEA